MRGAHVHNLGSFGSPDGKLVFDLNDFDETIRSSAIHPAAPGTARGGGPTSHPVDADYGAFIAAIKSGRIKSAQQAS